VSSKAPTSPRDVRAPAPRYGTPRRRHRPSRGRLVVSVASLLGWSLFPWQTHASAVAMEFDRATRLPHYRTVGIAVARQNGKTTLVCARIALQLIVPRATVAYTAQDRGLARMKWEEHVEILMDTPFAERVLRVDKAEHREMLVMHNGARYMPVTPSKRKAARSLSLDLAVIDEAHAHETMDVVGAIQPTMAARPFAQLWVLSNAGDFRSGLWRHYTDTGRLVINDPASSLCWIEYAADPDTDVLDRRAWLDANPTLDLPNGVTSAALADAALTMDADTFRREHLNVWVDVSQLTGIDPVAWAACRDDELTPGAQMALSLDFTPERDRGALVAAGDVDGRTPVEVIEAGSDLERLVARAGEIANRWQATIVIDRGGPAASAVPALERATTYAPGAHRVRLISLPDFVRACGDFHDAAIHGRLSHRGDYRLTDAVAGASKRRVGDAWLWRRRGGSDISPLVAATLARWGIVAAPEVLEPRVW
jgi:hypothetical protein